MAREFSKSFYNSVAWMVCRLAFLKSKFFICERCGLPATIAHHKEYLTPENINNPDITLNWELLEALCQDCHNKEHHGDDTGAVREGLTFDSKGNLIELPPVE